MEWRLTSAALLSKGQAASGLSRAGRAAPSFRCFQLQNSLIPKGNDLPSYCVALKKKNYLIRQYGQGKAAQLNLLVIVQVCLK